MNYLNTNLLILKWDPSLVDAAIELSVNFILLLDAYDKDRYKTEIAAYQELRIYYIDNFSNLESITSIGVLFKNKYTQLKFIASFGEHSQYAASLLGTILGAENALGFMSMVESRDKRAMKDVAKRASIKSAQWTAFDKDSKKSLLNQVAQFDPPLVVKPVNQFGAKGIKKYNSWNEIGRLSNDQNFDCSQQIIIEEYVEGKEYWVDTIWHKGKIKYIYVGTYLNNNIEVANGLGNSIDVYLLPSEHQDLYEKFREISIRQFNEVKMINGVGHSEYFVNQNGDVILGEFATRVAGAGLSEAVRYMTGESLMKLYLRTILGNFSESHPSNKSLKKAVGIVRLMPNTNGMVKSYKGIDTVVRRDDVIDVHLYKEVGDIYMKTGAATACASVFVTGSSIESISASVAEIVETVEIKIDSKFTLISVKN